MLLLERVAVTEGPVTEETAQGTTAERLPCVTPHKRLAGPEMNPNETKGKGKRGWTREGGETKVSSFERAGESPESAIATPPPPLEQLPQT